MILQIQEDRVIKAANAFPQVREVLKALFPEAFKSKLPLYQQLGFVPGTKWRHTKDTDNTYIYIGDTFELGKAIGLPCYNNFFSIAPDGTFAFTLKKQQT